MTTATYAPTTPIFTTPPQLQPYGFFGDLLRTVAPIAGQTIGGFAGNQQLGGQIGNAFGNIASLFPFAAGPVMPQAANPQQIVQAQQIAQAQLAQHQALLQQQAIAQQQAVAQQQVAVQQALAQHAVTQQALAQHALAQQQQLQPYGFFGDLFRTVAPIAGQAIGGLAGNQQLGGQIGNTFGNIASLFPFAAGPVTHQQPQQWQQPQLQPYGLFGGMLGNFLGGLGGTALGGVFGNSDLGNIIGRTAGSALGGIVSPFAAVPFPYGYPYGASPYSQN